MDAVRARAFVDEQYSIAFGTRTVAAFAEYLLVPGAIVGRAVLGYRRAGTDALFLERYLDQPIERAVSKALGRSVDRQAIVEIGNLAADGAWPMVELWGAAANDLAGSSEIAVATLTLQLRRMLGRIGVPLRMLCPARPRSLGAAAADWGSYYLHDPWVCAGSIAEGQRAIAAFLALRRKRAA